MFEFAVCICVTFALSCPRWDAWGIQGGAGATVHLLSHRHLPTLGQTGTDCFTYNTQLEALHTRCSRAKLRVCYDRSTPSMPRSQTDNSGGTRRTSRDPIQAAPVPEPPKHQCCTYYGTERTPQGSYRRSADRSNCIADSSKQQATRHCTQGLVTNPDSAGTALDLLGG